MTPRLALRLDRRDRLTAATVSAQSITYRAYANGARRSKDVGGTVTQYLVSADHVIAEYGPGAPGTATLLRRYVHGLSTDKTIAMVEGGAGSYTRSYYHADRLGNVVALTDDSGAASERYAYDAYGRPFAVDGSGATAPVTSGQPYLFTGRRFDFETGLYYYRARYYSAFLGRFLQTDPIGYDDQMNLYAYVGNDPVNSTDPSGKCPWCLGALVGAVIGGVSSYASAVIKEAEENGGSLKAYKQALTSDSALKAGATGALTGALVGSGAGVFATGVGAVVIGGGVEAGAQALGAEGDSSDIVAASFDNLAITAGGVGGGKLVDGVATVGGKLLRSNVAKSKVAKFVKSSAAETAGLAVTYLGTQDPPHEALEVEFEADDRGNFWTGEKPERLKNDKKGSRF